MMFLTSNSLLSNLLTMPWLRLMVTQILKMVSFHLHICLLQSASHSMPFKVHYQTFHNLNNPMPLL